METKNLNPSNHRTIALFGATGTVGDGLLEAALADPGVDRIHVVTRRPSPRIEVGVAAGKVVMSLHRDYLDYSAVRGVLEEADAVFWAIGLSAVGLDEATYREIHAGFPRQALAEWLEAGDRTGRSFHYVSGSGAGADSRMMWAREKARAEQALEGQASGTDVRVISYRPAFVTPTEAERNLAHRLLHALFEPIGYAVRAEDIGAAMLEVSARGGQVPNGSVLENRQILGLADAYAGREAKP